MQIDNSDNLWAEMSLLTAVMVILLVAFLW